MQPAEHPDVMAVRGDVEVHLLTPGDHAVRALGLLDRAQALVSFDVVDELDRQRVRDLADGALDVGHHWHGLVAERSHHDQGAVGFAGLELGNEPGDDAVATMALDRGALPLRPVVLALLAGAERLAWEHEAGRFVVWLRSAKTGEVLDTATAGFDVFRRLAILERSTANVVVGAPPEGITSDTFVADRDAADLAALLEGAYVGTPDAGWTVDAVMERVAQTWFRPEDVLLARHADGSMAGVHWTKRREDGLGEVYNLAIAATARRRGIGGWLLRRGLAHLAAQGRETAVLWVDLDNDRGVTLYGTHGFVFRHEDVAFVRELRGR